MARMYNPACCCCFPFCHGKFGVGLVTFFDVGIAFLTLVVTLYLMLHYSPSRPKTYEGDVFVFWYGVVTIPLSALVSLISGCKLLASLHYKTIKIDKGYLVKALLFFTIEFLGWLLPILLVKEYDEKINVYINNESGLIFFYLLKVNPLTIFLFVYGLYTIFLVHFYMENLKKKKLRQNTIKEMIPLTPQSNPELFTACNNIPTATADNSATATAPTEDEISLEEVVVTERRSRPRSRVRRHKRAVRKTADTQVIACHKYFTTESFASLRKKCLLAGTLYEDPDFDVQRRSLDLAGRNCEWKRPYQISSKPQFVCDGVSRFDVNQGELGNCYFLAALANLALHDKLFKKVICLDDNIIGHEYAKHYAGICRFKFFVNGMWEEVIIDDRLPVNKKGELIFAKSMDKNEYWSCLVEKAYAKLFGSYSAIGNGGLVDEAMKNLTGGKTEAVRFNGANLYRISRKITETLKNGGLVGVGKFYPDDDVGLVGRHAYSITQMTRITLTPEKVPVQVIRIRNPWGTGDEWTGEWCDNHEIWESVDPKVRKQLKIKFKEDGEFWFPFKDFPKYFDIIYTCVVD